MKKITALAFLIISFTLSLSCGTNKEDRGKMLAETYCGSCHLYPDPNILDKATWENGVLPEMGIRMGQLDNFNKLASFSQDELLEKINHHIYSDKPYMSQEDWELLKAYILSKAPEKPLAQKNKIPIDTNESNLFKTIIKPSKLDLYGNTISITLKEGEKGFSISSESKHWVNFDEKGNMTSYQDVPGTFVQTISRNNQKFSLSIGRMNPNELKMGKLYKLENNEYTPISHIDSLRRPVSFDIGDLNQDGIDDFVICEFGFEVGQLSWFDGKTLKKHVLKSDPGARNIILKDFNQDGKLDILALMTQSREGVYLFLNKGNNNFEEKALLTFQPAFGSSYLELADLNQDGKEDIIIANGDNGDYSYSKKNYHGIHYFENQGNFEYKEKLFFPIYGLTKAILKDFDQDGDLDIASTAYYFEKDQKQNERFLYFENKGNLKFTCSNFNIPYSGKYIALEAGDIDLDGDMDIILGSYKIDKRIEEGELMGHQFTLLLNQLNK